MIKIRQKSKFGVNYLYMFQLTEVFGYFLYSLYSTVSLLLHYSFMLFEQIKEYYQEAVKLLESSGTSEMGSQLRKVSKFYVMFYNTFPYPCLPILMHSRLDLIQLFYLIKNLDVLWPF